MRQMVTPNGKTVPLLRCFSSRNITISGDLLDASNCVCFVYAVKHDECHKAQLMANGNLKNKPLDGIYSAAEEFVLLLSLQSSMD